MLARRRHARALTDVVAPAHARLVEQPRDGRPDIRPWLAHLRRPDLRGLVGVDAAGELLVRRARHRVVEVGAGGGPGRDHEQVGRKRPRIGGREHAVVQRERARVFPVDRKFLVGVVAHHVGLTLWTVDGLRTRLLVGVLVAPVADHAPGFHESVHRTAVDRDRAAHLAMRAALIDEVRVVVRAMAPALDWVRQAHLRAALRVHRDAVGAGEGAEVVIERPVLQHDEDQVVEVHDAGGRVERARAVGHRLQVWRRAQRPKVDPLGGERGVGLAHEVRRAQHVGGLDPRRVGGLGGHRLARRDGGCVVGEAEPPGSPSEVQAIATRPPTATSETNARTLLERTWRPMPAGGRVTAADRRTPARSCARARPWRRQP